MKKKKSELAVENDLRQADLDLEDQHTLQQIYQYVSSCQVTEEEVEGIRKDLIGMAKEARERGGTLKGAIGEDQQAFSNDLVYAVTGKTVPKGRKLLKISAGFWLGWAVASGFAYIWCTFIILYYVYSDKVTISTIVPQFSDLQFWGLIGLGAVETVLLFLAGRYGYKHCGDASKAKFCCWIGAALIIQEVYEIISRGMEVEQLGMQGVFPVLLTIVFVLFAAGYLAGAFLNTMSGQTQENERE